MATVVSLTEEKIHELLAGWEGVELSQDELNALVTQLWVNNETQDALLTEFNAVTLPAVRADVAASSIQVSALTDMIPGLELQLDQHQLSIDNINTAVLPPLQTELASANNWILELNEVILPDFETRLAANDATMVEFNTVTLPSLNTRLNTVEADVAAIDISGLQTDLDAAEAQINTLNTVTLPALDSRLVTAEANIAAIDISGLQTDLDAAEAQINALNTVTLPALDSRLVTAEGEVTALEGKFPIAGPDIQADAIDANHIQADAITTSEIAAGAVTAAEIAANTITAAEIATGAITADEIAANAVIAAKIAADAVTAGKIAADAITAREIQADAITASEIAANTVTAAEIATGAITADEIAANAVVAAKIAADAVTAGKIAADAITAREIQADAITASEIAGRTITANEIAADTITANEIAADTITANEIAADTITAAEIAADTITANEIATDAITASEIAADTITANEIAADTITANEIAADTITANEIATGTITALEIMAGTITGKEIAADSIAVTKLIVSDLTNLIVDGELLDPTLSTWHEVGPTKVRRVKNLGEPAYIYNTNTASATHIFFRNENAFEIKPLDEFYVSVEVSAPATNTQDLSLLLAIGVYDNDGASQLWRGIEEGDHLVSPGETWRRIEGTIKIDALATGLATAKFNPYVHGIAGAAGAQEIRLRRMSMRRKGTGKLIVDGSIEGKQIRANSITADEIDAGTITGDLFAGEVVMSGLVRAGQLNELSEIIGGYSEMGSLGILTVDDQGETVASFPTDSSSAAFLKAHVDLLSADVRDNFTMHGTNNSIAVESELTLSAGVEAPTVPPTLQQVWDQVQLNKTTAVPPHAASAGYNLGTFAFNPSQVTSMAWNSMWSCWVVIQQKSNGFRVWRFTASGDIYNNIGSGRPWVDDYDDRIKASVCYNDDANGEAYLFQSGEQWYIWAPENLNKIPASWIVDTADRPPTITYDTANNQYCLVQNNGGGTGTIHVRRFTITGGSNFPNATSASTSNFEAGSGQGRRINGAVFGTQLGISGWAINADDYHMVYTFNSAGVEQNDEGSYRNWRKPGAALGFAHNGTQFASVDSAGVITFYDNWTWTQADSYLWVGASAFDSDTAGNQANPHVGQLAGQHETPVGTMRSISMYRRSKLRISMPETNDSGAADDPDKWRLYFKRGGNVAPTDKTLLKHIADIGSPTAATSITISADAIGGAPPGGIKGQPGAINNFPGADPGRIESAKTDGLGAVLQMLGDGTGRWGTLTVDADGKAVIGGDTGWITPTLTGGWANFGAPFSGAAYRRIGNVVYLRGLVKDGLFGATNPIFTLPAGFRPNGGAADGDLILTATAHRKNSEVAGDGTKVSSAPNDNVTTLASSHTHGMKQHTHSVTYSITSNMTQVGHRVDVMSDGRVHCSDQGGVWVSLAGISFLVD